MIQWQWKFFNELSRDELFELLLLRQAVFVVEQHCPYQDADPLDRDSWHLLGWREENSARELVAYLRVNASGIRYAEPSIGRVLTAASARGQGLGKELIAKGIECTECQFPGEGIRISAQLYLQKFYASFGFKEVSEPYEEDEIPHIEMLKPGSTS